MFVISEDQKIPIKAWVANQEAIEPDCLTQAKHLANLPFAFRHVALMPDCHCGYGMPIGGVLATKNTIISNAVGVDIGCGMIFRSTNIPISAILESKTKDDQPLINFMLGTISRVIPVGFAHHKEAQNWGGFETAPNIEVVQRELASAQKQLGTLGGGNHFIELQKDELDNLCLMIHSGSRNFGKQICDEYNKKAKLLNEKWRSIVDPKWDLAFLPMDSDEGQEYFAAMNYALEFAQQNRYLMMERLTNVVFNLIEKYHGKVSCKIVQDINAHHNYAAYENHFGENVIVHRKGAIRVRPDELGIIPGSMETASYIVRGVDSPENVQSFNSASHGAGRKMSRKKARELFRVDDVLKNLDKKGITLQTPNRGDVVDECGSAYKDIDEVMAQESGLVQVISKLNQIGVIKG